MDNEIILQRTIELLVVAGHVSQEDVDKATKLAEALTDKEAKEHGEEGN